MAETWNKKEREKKKQQAKKEKAERKQERKENTKDGNNLDSMLAYLDENGNLSSKPPDPTVIGIDEVAQLAAHQGASTLRVLAQHHLVPDAHQINTVNLDQRKPSHIARLCRYLHWIGHSTVQAARLFKSLRFGWRWKDKMTYALQFAQCLDATTDLWATACVREVEVLTHGLGNRGTIFVSFCVEQGAHDFD